MDTGSTDPTSVRRTWQSTKCFRTRPTHSNRLRITIGCRGAAQNDYRAIAEWRRTANVAHRFRTTEEDALRLQPSSGAKRLSQGDQRLFPGDLLVDGSTAKQPRSQQLIHRSVKPLLLQNCRASFEIAVESAAASPSRGRFHGRGRLPPTRTLYPSCKDISRR